MWRDQHERVAVAVAHLYEDPFAYVAAALDGFDQFLVSDPEQFSEDMVERKIAELMEEVA